MNNNISKILFINSTSKVGGGQIQMLHLIKGLIKCGQYEISVIIPNDGPFWGYLEELNVKLIDIPVRTKSFRTMLKSISAFKGCKPDIIHTNGIAALFYGAVLKTLFKIKLIHTFHGFYIETFPFIKRISYLLLQSMIGTFCIDYGIAVSESEKSYLLSKKLIPGRKLHLIYNGANEPVDKGEVELPPKGNDLIIGTVTKIHYQKGIDILIKAVPFIEKFIKDFKILIIGTHTDNNLEYYEDTTLSIKKDKLAKKHVQLLGPQKNIAVWLDYFDIFISVSRWEGLPLSVLEAALRKKLIVASDVIGNNEIVIDGITGFLIRKLDGENIADTIVNAYNCKDKEQITKNCYNYVTKKFSMDVMLSKHKELYITAR